MKISRICALAGLVLLTTAYAGTASATQYQVVGSVVFNGGDPNALPAFISFGDSYYDPGNGDLSAGAFNFPESTAVIDSGNGSVTYQFSQTNTSMGLVGADGTAILKPVIISLHITAASYNGSTISVGSNCIFAPILWNNLHGSIIPSGFEVAQASFTVPPAADGACGAYTSFINDALEGNNNSIELRLNGSFALPSVSDLIFINGFGL